MLARLLPAAAATIVTLAAAVPARAQDYAGPFATAAAGGTSRYAQLIYLPGGGPYQIGRFDFTLGDFHADGSGAALQFRASVFTLDGFRLGTRLYESEVRAGSGNYSAFDRYRFDPNVALIPGVERYALVLEATGGPPTAQNVIEINTSGPTAPEFALHTVDDAGSFRSTGTPAVYTVYLVSTPEPATVALVAGGLAGIGTFARRRRTTV